MTPGPYWVTRTRQQRVSHEGGNLLWCSEGAILTGYRFASRGRLGAPRTLVEKEVHYISALARASYLNPRYKVVLRIMLSRFKSKVRIMADFDAIDSIHLAKYTRLVRRYSSFHDEW